ncbi:hypothetical protein PPL_00321 [Heterostelium album PN500]|uniref:Peptidase M20 dimerisation domain-containing protein n=1 Tax=Heterostelium pallidum (strain ATCC 26659 / Pp 5 / PN500) TaxID=670386 RepID=D3AW52_HETP5|nr:hypothetical protein PPL_00321 [Heterostelium album PN500]EFA86525.1 hypothetical protein PPL_00321 [Heterostelium album PN500]|eukprot:XP_020438630.1 hypothetical protein PPL_00321 [Heterostelium album PN500]
MKLNIYIFLILYIININSILEIKGYPQSKENVISLKLANAIKIQTISYGSYDVNSKKDNQQFDEFIKYLRVTFPLIHNKLKVNIINNHSLLYQWEGKNKDLLPILINSHYDVVPVDKSSWTVDPFGGVIKDGYIWGRGAIDDKSSVIASMEAVEYLLSQSLTLKRSIYLAIGHDEELQGAQGHKKIAEYLMNNKIKAEMIIDEGNPLREAGYMGVKNKTSVIGVYEKGSLFYTISANGTTGHSSMPPSLKSPIGILAKAIIKLESNPVPYFEDKQYQNPYLDLFSPEQISTNPSLYYIKRTTTTVTMFNSGIKPNVLPVSATAWVSHRVAPGIDIPSLVERNIKLINDTRITLKVLSTRPLSPYSSPNSTSYNAVKQTILRVFGDNTEVYSGGMLANTDTIHYWHISPNIFRITPIIVNDNDYGIHKSDEKLSTTNLLNFVNFYENLILNMNK